MTLRLLAIAARNLVSHRQRSGFLVAAIGLVTAVLVVLLSLAAGMRHTLFEAATTFVSGHVNISGFFKPKPSAAWRLVSQIPRILEQVRQTVPEVESVVLRTQSYGKLVSDTAALDVAITGVDWSREEKTLIQRLTLKRGSLAGLSSAQGLLLFEDQARQLHVDVGDPLTFVTTTLRGAVSSVDGTVVAIAQDAGLLSGFTVFSSETMVRSLLQIAPDAATLIQLYLRDADQAEAVAARLRETLAKQGFSVLEPESVSYWEKQERLEGEPWTGHALDVTLWSDEIEFFGWTVEVFTALSALVIIVLLTMVALGLMNSFWIAIRERTQEIGTLRAIGMDRSLVVQMFLWEGWLLGVVGSFVGGILGLLACGLISYLGPPLPFSARLLLMSDRLRFAVEWPELLAALLCVTVSTTFIALIPSLRAARLPPVAAMQRSE